MLGFPHPSERLALPAPPAPAAVLTSLPLALPSWGAAGQLVEDKKDLRFSFSRNRFVRCARGCSSLPVALAFSQGRGGAAVALSPAPEEDGQAGGRWPLPGRTDAARGQSRTFQAETAAVPSAGRAGAALAHRGARGPSGLSSRPRSGRAGPGRAFPSFAPPPFSRGRGRDWPGARGTARLPPPPSPSALQTRHIGDPPLSRWCVRVNIWNKKRCP